MAAGIGRLLSAGGNDRCLHLSPPGNPQFSSLSPSGAQRVPEAGQCRCGGAPRSVGGGTGGAGTPPVTQPGPRCPPPAGFADGPERTGSLRGPRPCPRAQPRPPHRPAPAAAATRCASSREARPGAGEEPGAARGRLRWLLAAGR